MITSNLSECLPSPTTDRYQGQAVSTFFAQTLMGRGVRFNLSETFIYFHSSLSISFHDVYFYPFSPILSSFFLFHPFHIINIARIVKVPSRANKVFIYLKPAFTGFVWFVLFCHVLLLFGMVWHCLA